MTPGDLKDYFVAASAAVAAFFGWRNSQHIEANTKGLEDVKKSTDGVVEKLAKAKFDQGEAVGTVKEIRKVRKKK
jgi:hypothetical protein